MELDATTIGLQVVNFLILVLILQRLLYRPVLAAIARRRAGVEKTLADAQGTLARAGELEVQYQGRLEDWNRERQQSRAQLQQQLDAERSRCLAALEVELATERARQAALDARRNEDQRAAIETQALRQAAEFCAKMLARMASPDLEAHIVVLMVEDLQTVKTKWREALDRRAGPIEVTTAYPLAAPQRELLTTALRQIAGDAAQCSFEQDPALIAGVRISAGGSVVHANLADELSFFTEVHGAGER